MASADEASAFKRRLHEFTAPEDPEGGEEGPLAVQLAACDRFGIAGLVRADRVVGEAFTLLI